MPRVSLEERKYQQLICSEVANLLPGQHYDVPKRKESFVRAYLRFMNTTALMTIRVVDENTIRIYRLE